MAVLGFNQASLELPTTGVVEVVTADTLEVREVAMADLAAAEVVLQPTVLVRQEPVAARH
jgi:hypothetical protein